MRSYTSTGKYMSLQEQGNCRACRCYSETGCAHKWPPWPHTCAWQNSRAGPRKICKVNIPTVTSESMYVNRIAAENTRGGYENRPRTDYANVNWNQMSDRAVPGRQTVHVPRHRTRHRPGGNGQVGRGVDVKHDSYQRYLNRKKGNLRIKNFVTTSDFYNKGCGCWAYDTVGTSPYGQQLKS